MLDTDTDAAVFDGKLRSSRGILPFDPDRTMIRGITHGIGNQITKRAAQLIGTTTNVRPINGQRNLVVICR